MSKKIVIGGNDAIAYAAKQSSIDVISAYPITPQTSIIEKIADFISSGEMKTRFIKVESEHSAMAAAMGASIAGSRVFTATSSQGLLLMHEVLHWASGARLPIVMANANRAVAPPWSIWAEQTDSLSQRDTGWVQLYASNAQEAYDYMFISFRVAEKIRIPVMICMDGFLVTHTKEPVEIFEGEIDDYINIKEKRDILDVENPQAYGALAFPKDYMPIKMEQHKAVMSASDVFKDMSKKYADITKRHYKAVETYGKNDADIAIVAMGSISETAHYAVDILNESSIKAKLVKINMFRPFPKQELQTALNRTKHIIVFDRDISHGKGGIIKDEVAGSLGLGNVIGFVCGLGGVDVTEQDMVNAANDVINGKIKEDGFLWSEK